MSRLLTAELGTAESIKSPGNRKAVINAITSVQHRLKLVKQVPTNGLVIFCGNVVSDDGKSRKINVDIEPPRPVVCRILYFCGNKFRTEDVWQTLLTDDKCFGFIVADGSGCLLGKLHGNVQEVLLQFSVDLPQKHGRGGQSANRFARLRQEARHNYVKKIAEAASNVFLRHGTTEVDGPNRGALNVTGLILAGSADVKNELSAASALDRRLKDNIVKVVDVAYGGRKGFNEAIGLCSDLLRDVRLVQEKRIVQEYFDLVHSDERKICFGVKDVMAALEAGAARTVVCWQDLTLQRRICLDPKLGTEVTVYPRHDDVANLDVLREESVVDWLVDNCAAFGARLELISGRNEEGSQFVRGFGGLGAILRYPVDFHSLDGTDDDNNRDILEELGLDE